MLNRHEQESMKRIDRGITPSIVRDGALITLLIGALTATTAWSQQRKPFKLWITVPPKVHWVGDSATVWIEVRDTANKSTPVRKTTTVGVTLKTPTGKVEPQKVQIEKDRSMAEITLDLPEAGLNDVRATNPTLMTGQNVINVFAPSPGRAKGKRSTARPPKVPHHTSHKYAHLKHFAIVAPNSNVAKAAKAPGVAPVVPSEGIVIALRITPERKLLADEIDTAMIHAFLTAPAPTLDREVKVYLYSGDESPEPNPIVIHAGENEGTATFRSAHAGLVKIVAKYAEPKARFDPRGGAIQATFGPPITAINVIRPPLVWLFGSSKLDVQLVDPEGVMVKTDEPRNVVISISRGSGEILPSSFSIPKGESHKTVRFLPVETGSIRLLAATPELNPQPVDFDVTWPVSLLLWSVLGGALGGVAALTRRRRWWVLLAVISGPALYWGLAYAGVLARMPTSALNPFPAVIIAMVGGYLGPEVFGILAKAYGLGRAPAGGGGERES
jgi:hypothetical protein